MPVKDREKRLAYFKWYNQNRSEEAKQTHKRKIKDRRRQLAVWLNNHKLTLKCNRCPEARWPCLDFHHQDPTKKVISISVAIHHGWSITRVMSEMRKCEVICSNCHRVEHLVAEPEVVEGPDCESGY